MRTWFKDLRIRAGFAQQQDLAEALHVSPAFVSQVESGAKRPGGSLLIRMEEKLGPEVITGFRAEAHAEPSQQAS